MTEATATTGLSLWPLVVLGAGAFVAALRWALLRVVASFERHLQRMERIEARIQEVEARAAQMYQRREDAIREYSTLNFKLDRLYEVLLAGTRATPVTPTPHCKDRPHDPHR